MGPGEVIPHREDGPEVWYPPELTLRGRYYFQSLGHAVWLVGFQRNTRPVHGRPGNRCGTFVGPNTGRGSFVDGNGLASDAAGHRFGAASDFNVSAELFSVDASTAVSMPIAPLTGRPGRPSASISALAFNDSGTLFGVVLEVDPSGSAFLVTINTTSGAITNAGQTVDALDAIAFVSPTSR